MMHQSDDNEEPNLVGYYRPIAIKAVVAALSVQGERAQSETLKATEYTGPAVEDYSDWDEPGVSFIR